MKKPDPNPTAIAAIALPGLLTVYEAGWSEGYDAGLKEGERCTLATLKSMLDAPQTEGWKEKHIVGLRFAINVIEEGIKASA